MLQSLLENVFILIPLVLSLTVHEWAHAMAAVRLGDDTPIRQGRLTLNPIPHIDPIGTILLPLLGVPFGWAKPVEWNPSRIRRGVPMKRAMWMVALAGPASNLVLGFVSVLLLMFAPMIGLGTELGFDILVRFFTMNVGLAVFNMLPIPPLDGSRVVDANIPRSLAEFWSSVHRYAPFILLAVIIIPPVRAGISMLVGVVAEAMLALAQTIAGR